MSHTSGDETSTRTFDQQNRCINCSFKIPRNQPRHLMTETPTPLVKILQSWITPTQIPPESVICTECFEILKNGARATSNRSVLKLPGFGHRKICFPCGSSILRARRTYPVRADRLEKNILSRFVPHHLVSRMERVCAACWRSATREVQRQQQHDTNRPILAATVSGVNNIPEPPPLPPLRQPSVRPQTPKITSAIYRRAANTSSHCIFVDCFEKERLLIPSTIKQLLLSRYKFYIPAGARICQHHLDKGSWSELTSQLRDFSSRQFDNIMEMMQQATNNQLDFSNVSDIPPHLCKYFLGMDSNQFNVLLNSIPNLTERVPDATKALCIHLVKLRTGDSNEKLATLFNISRSTLERVMAVARNCLNFR